jgi:hypothetical protein
MAYKFQEGNANFDGEISGSSFRTAGSLTGSGDLAVTGNMHAAIFYGSGAGITGISSDAVDVTASSGDLAFPLVFTEGAQADGSLGLALNTALNYNPNDGLLSSSAGAEFVGASRFVGALGVTGAATLASTLDVTGLASLDGGIDVNGSNFTVSTAGAVTAASTIRMAQGNSLSFNGDTNTAKITNNGQQLDINSPGAIVLNAGTFVSSSDGAQFVGNSIFGGTLHVSGAQTLGGALSSSAGAAFVGSVSSSGDIAVTGAVHAAQFYGGGAGITGISSDAVDVTASSADLAYPIVFTEGAQSNGSLGLALNTALTYNPNDAVVSSSAGIQAVGAAIFGGGLLVSGAADGNAISSSAGANFGGSMTVSGLNSSGSITLQEGGTFGTSADADLFTLTAGKVVIAGDLSGSSMNAEFGGRVVAQAGLRASGSITLQEGGTFGTSADADLFTLTTDQVTLKGFLSSSSPANIAGATTLGDALNVTGAAALASTLSVNSLANLDGGIEIDNSGNKFTVGTNGALSASAMAEIVGNSVFVGEVAASGGFRSTAAIALSSSVGYINAGTAWLQGINTSGSIVMQEGTNIGPSTDSDLLTLTNSQLLVKGNLLHQNGIISSSGGDLQVPSAIVGGAMDVSGNVTIAGNGMATKIGQFVGGMSSSANVIQFPFGAWSGPNFFASGNVKSKGALSASSVSELVGSISSSGDLAVTGNVHAAVFYGSGAGITGISSDAVDVTASLGSSQVYGIVGTQAIQSDGTLGLITTVSGASFNPLDATWGSKLRLSGSNSGLQASQLHFADIGGLGVVDSDGYLLKLTSSEAGIDISGSHDSGIALYGGQGAEAGVSIVQSPLYVFTDEESNYVFHVDPTAGAVSGGAGAQFVGASIFGNNLTVSGNIDSGGDLTVATITGPSVFSVDASGDVIVDSIKTNGNEFVVTTAGAVTTTGLTNAGGASAVISSSQAAEIVGNSRFVGNVGVTGAISLASAGGGLNFDGGSNVIKITNNGGGALGFGGPLFTFNNKISGSGALEIVGASTFVGAMVMSSSVRMESGQSLSFNGSSNTAKITNNGTNLDINSPGPIIMNAATFVSSGVGAQFVGASIFGGALNVTGALTASTLESHGAYNHGYRRYDINTVTANKVLAVSAKSYQIVSGGTAAITVTLPAASAGQYYQYGIKRHSLMSGNVVIDANGSELIDGEANITLSTVNASVYLISDGTQWNIF